MTRSTMALRTAAAVALTATSLTLSASAGADPDTCNPVDGTANSCAGQPMQTWPLAQGDFTSPGDPGWIYFKPFFYPAGYTGSKADAARAEQYGCGIGPDGTVGCDHVPSDPWQGSGPGCGDLRCPPPPPGANQTVAGPQQPGQYVQSPVATFTRNVGDLPQGYRLANGDAWCAVGYQGSLTCNSGANGFTLAWWGGSLRP